MADPSCEPVRSARDDLLLTGFADKALVLDRTAARVHVLNSSAAWIWGLIDGDRTIDDIAAVIASASGLDPATIRIDVGAAVEHFDAAGLLGAERSPDPIRRPGPLDPFDAPMGDGDPDEVDGGRGRDVHQVGPYRAIGLTVAVRSDSSIIAAELDELLRGLACDAEPDGTYVVATHEEGIRYRAHIGAVAITSADEVRRVVDGVLIDLNRRAIERADGRLLFHSGAVELDGTVVALPAASGRGKSTLTAALVSTGAGYVTDEATVVDPVTFAVEPYPKPLALTAASLEAVRHAAPAGASPEIRPTPSIAPGPTKSHVAATTFGSVRATSAPLGALVFPDYVPDAATELVALDVEDALLALVPCTFAATWAVPGALGRLVDLVGSVPAFRLTFSDLDAASVAVRSAVTAGAHR